MTGMAAPDHPLAPIEPLLVAEIRQYRRASRDGALALAVTLWLIVACGALTLARRDALQAGILAAVLGVPAVTLMWVAGSRNPSRHRALSALRARGESVVWVYTRLYHGSHRLDELVFNFEDGRSESIPVDPARSRDLLTRVAATLPRASVGFSPETATVFMRAPKELYRSTPQLLGAAERPLDTAWLVPFAASDHRSRRWIAGLGILLVLLGALGIVIVAAAASPRDQPALIIAMLAVVAVIPGVLIARWAFAPFETTVLAAALRAPADRVRSVELTHQANVEGDYVDVAVVTLTTGRTFVFSVPPQSKGVQA